MELPDKGWGRRRGQEDLRPTLVYCSELAKPFNVKGHVCAHKTALWGTGHCDPHFVGAEKGSGVLECLAQSHRAREWQCRPETQAFCPHVRLAPFLPCLCRLWDAGRAGADLWG